ncbi:MAG: hypothetical protein JSR17_10580 [Proteobacteria bacterium]|nr:hypothetical protein [Pseudomonadota bacterium]
MSRLKEVIEKIIENEKEGYQQLEALMQEKANNKYPSDSINLTGLLIDLNAKQKTTFLTKIAKLVEGRKITTVNLARNELNAKQLAAFVKNFKCKADVRVDASDNIIGQDAGELAQSLRDKNITSLDLSRCQMDDEALMSFGRQLKDNRLTTLVLKENAFSSASLAQFAKYVAANKIRRLSIDGNPIEAKDAVLLAVNLQPSLVDKLEANRCDLTNKGFEQLIQGLANGPVKQLDLCNNKISKVGAKEASIHFENTNIERIRLSSNQINTQGVCDFLANIKYSRVRFVDFSSNANKKGHDIAQIIPALKNTPITDGEFDFTCVSKEHDKEYNSILDKNALSNRLVRTYKSAKELVDTRSTKVTRSEIGFATLASFSTIIGAKYFSGLFKNLSWTMLSLTTLALSVIGAGLSSAMVYVFRNQVGRSDKQKYEQEYESVRKYATKLARRLDPTKHSDMVLTFAKTFNEAPHQHFDNTDRAVHLNDPKTKLFVLRKQVAEMKCLVRIPTENEESIIKKVISKVIA